MDIKIDVSIKLDKGKEIKLSHEQARKLYDELGKIFDNHTTYVPWYPIYPVYPTYPIVTYTTGTAGKMNTGTCTLLNDDKKGNITLTN